jgi:hypothetical protein
MKKAKITATAKIAESIPSIIATPVAKAETTAL